MALALRYGPVSIGAGAATFVNASGDGIAFKLGQDGNGAYADGNADVSLPYNLCPIAGAALDLGPAALALRFRGSQSIGMNLGTVATVDVTGNPLNGTTAVRVTGSNGYLPPTLDLGARYTIAPWLRALVALELALWSQAPSPAANLSMDVRLGLKPGLLETNFGQPRMRSTLSPRVGAEVLPLGRNTALSVRAGYLLSPSPVPQQTGFTSHADSVAHGFALGAGYDLGKAWGVGLRADASTMLMVLAQRQFNKPSEVLPFSHYTASGNIMHVSVALQGAWK
jgi:long-subunit fatty acid transport protein